LIIELLVLRHAKSSWKDPELEDHERPLNKRGQRAAVRMGRLMEEERLVPDRVICSTALRARSTWERIREINGWEIEAHLDSRIYHAAWEDLQACLHEVPPTVRRALLVGHNPSLEDLVEELTGDAVSLPTAALARLQAEGVWSTLRRAALLQVWCPRGLADPS